MGNKTLNTTYDFEMADGTTVKLTLAFYALYQLKSKNKSLYERYNKAMLSIADKKSGYDELEVITILYAAYVCANLNADKIMNEEEFIILCGADRVAVNTALEHLITPKKA